MSKSLLIIFFNINRDVYHEFVPTGSDCHFPTYWMFWSNWERIFSEKDLKHGMNAIGISITIMHPFTEYLKYQFLGHNIIVILPYYSNWKIWPHLTTLFLKMKFKSKIIILKLWRSCINHWSCFTHFQKRNSKRFSKSEKFIKSNVSLHNRTSLREIVANIK